MSPPLTSIPSLLAAVEAVPDQRRAAGRRHALPSVLACVCCGMLCGNRSLLALAEWGRAQQTWCCQTFGFKRGTPWLNTLHRVLAGLDVVAFEAALRAWIAPQLAEPEALEPIAMDGKAVRGTRAGPHLPGAYLLSVYASRRGAVLSQVAIGSRENELTQAIPALRQVDLAGKLVTGDALFTQARHLRAHPGPGWPLPVRGQGQPGHAAGHRDPRTTAQYARVVDMARSNPGLSVPVKLQEVT